MKKFRILWGVCGIGLGHARRQFPVIQHFAQSSEICIFTYGTGLSFFRKQFQGLPNIQIHEVSVPYWLGSPEGLDFAGSAQHPQNADLNFAANARAMDLAHRQIGQPHLVVSDYEPIAAQYAYAFQAPLVTLDQQSKYLGACLPSKLAGTGFADEVMRLRMFFPKAEKRLACSFFALEQNETAIEPVKIIPPILDQEICNLQLQPDSDPLILVYLSEQMKDVRQIESLINSLSSSRGARYAVYLPQGVTVGQKPDHVRFYKHGSALFLRHLASCHGIVATAGHSLLSEVMHLGIPVYALPLNLYEQQMNAQIVRQGTFGQASTPLTSRKLDSFIKNIGAYRRNILQDRGLLIRGNGLSITCKELDKILTL